MHPYYYFRPPPKFRPKRWTSAANLTELPPAEKHAAARIARRAGRPRKDRKVLKR